MSSSIQDWLDFELVIMNEGMLWKSNCTSNDLFHKYINKRDGLKHLFETGMKLFYLVPILIVDICTWSSNLLDEVDYGPSNNKGYRSVLVVIAFFL